VEVGVVLAQYLGRVSGGSRQIWAQAEELLVPVFALVVAVVGAVAGPLSLGVVVLCAIPVAAFGLWVWVPGVSLVLVAVAVLVPVVAVQRSGGHEPLMFEASVLAFVVARWSGSLAGAVALGLLAVASPVVVSVIESDGNISVGIWVLGIAFPWVIGRAILRQGRLTDQLAVARRELDQQAMLEQRRQIARDVHDFVGHGLAAVMLQVTSARHVLYRDPAAAEEALRSAEDVGRRSMQELRRTVALLRSDDRPGVRPPVPPASEIPGLVDDARAGGLAVELRVRGDLAVIAPSVGVAVYRIAQEALANAARHAPHARTVLGLEVADAHVCLFVETIGPVLPVVEGEAQRSRYGVIGMRERAAALGGELTAGPVPGGWCVSCRLPLQSPGEQAPAETAEAFGAAVREARSDD
jgi:signal transduction histidine kinase